MEDIIRYIASYTPNVSQQKIRFEINVCRAETHKSYIKTSTFTKGATTETDWKIELGVQSGIDSTI